MHSVAVPEEFMADRPMNAPPRGRHVFAEEE